MLQTLLRRATKETKGLRNWMPTLQQVIDVFFVNQIIVCINVNHLGKHLHRNVMHLWRRNAYALTASVSTMFVLVNQESVDYVIEGITLSSTLTQLPRKVSIIMFPWLTTRITKDITIRVTVLRNSNTIHKCCSLQQQYKSSILKVDHINVEPYCIMDHSLISLLKDLLKS